MEKQLLEALFDHSAWANARMLDACRGLAPERWQETHEDGQDLRSVLTHALNAEMIWRQRFEGVPQGQLVIRKPEEFPTPADLVSAWREEEQRWRRWFATCTPEKLDENFQVHSASLPLWQFVTQVPVHAAQHRAEAALMLTELGHSPGELDFLHYAVGHDEW